MPTYRMPGTYVEERPQSPPAITDAASAVPLFVGYTQKAARDAVDDLLLQPTPVDSLLAFERLFGFAHASTIEVAVSEAGQRIDVQVPAPSFLLYHALALYFANGGGRCHVVSCGLYADAERPRRAELLTGLQAAEAPSDATLLLAPDAVRCKSADYSAVVAAMLAHCAAQPNRFAIVDVHGGDAAVGAGEARSLWTMQNLRYGAAYYPFLRCSLSPWVDEFDSNVQVSVEGAPAVSLAALQQQDAALATAVEQAIAAQPLTLPPSGAIAGLYVHSDATRGIWKAPANVAVALAIEPAVRLGSDEQDDYNVDSATGRSINVIRAFTGKGTVVWGSRTLAGNDNEWRYVPIRRFFSLVTQSIEAATQWAVFEAHDAGTWARLRAQIENYLIQKWRLGALAGTRPEQALYVHCGLGSTMTQRDIDQGRLVIEIGLAAVRPAEFIVQRIEHAMQQPATGTTTDTADAPA